MAKLTVIIPSYNHKTYIEQRLDSILNQTYKDWEAIIIDDASTDNSYQIIEKYIDDNPDFKVKQIIKNKVNSGSGYKSWQKGIELAETEYIWIAETDDFSSQIFLESVVQLLDKSPDCVLAFSASTYVNENGNALYDTSKRQAVLNLQSGKSKVFNGQEILKLMPLNPIITNASCTVFRKPKKAIPHEIFNHKQCSDLFLWTYLLKGKSFGFVNINLNFFRQHPFSTTTQNYKLRRKEVYKEKVEYLNYFNKTEQYKELIYHYIKHYVSSNSKDVFKFKFLKDIKTSNSISKYYFKSLFRFLTKKIL